jgi:two-component system response regulator HydG
MRDLLEFDTRCESAGPLQKRIAPRHFDAPKRHGVHGGAADSSASSAEARLTETLYELMPEMAELRDQVKRIVPQDVSLLLTGETGTGKTRLARLIHDLSPRRDEPFLIVDCGSLANNLIESEIFGHVRGAFTGADRQRSGKFAAAGRGTLVLDEINSLPLSLQSKLLRAVDERVFEAVGSNKPEALEARLIAITNTSLEAEVVAGRFRADLYYRINVVGFYLQPLHTRPGAIARLARKFLFEFADRNRPDVTGLAVEALTALEQYSWPGNVRELRNVMERAVALCHGPNVQVADLPETVRFGSAVGPAVGSAFGAGRFEPPPQAPAPTPWQASVDRDKNEIARIRFALEKHNNNRLRAAAELGISRMGLYKKLRKYGFTIKEPKEALCPALAD